MSRGRPVQEDVQGVRDCVLCPGVRLYDRGLCASDLGYRLKEKKKVEGMLCVFCLVNYLIAKENKIKITKNNLIK